MSDGDVPCVCIDNERMDGHDLDRHTLRQRERQSIYILIGLSHSVTVD